jgi:hypothetical protein
MTARDQFRYNWGGFPIREARIFKPFWPSALVNTAQNAMEYVVLNRVASRLKQHRAVLTVAFAV